MEYIRTYLGMSQNLYAAWIGIERSLLAKRELRIRNIHRFKEANQKERELEIQWRSFKESYTPEAQTPPRFSWEEVNRKKKGFVNCCGM